LPSNPLTNDSGGGSARRIPRLTSDRAAALVYTAASFLVALAFWLVTTFMGDYTRVARWGGAAWIFLLMMIVLMPIVIPWMRRRRQPAEEPMACLLPEPPQQS
jgi:uncharacterized membrane protein